MPPKYWIRQYAGRLQLWLCLFSGLCSGGRTQEHSQTGSIDSFCNSKSSIYLACTEQQLLRPVLSWNIARFLETSPCLADFCGPSPICTGYHLMLNFYWAMFKFTRSNLCFTAVKTYWQEDLCPPPVKNLNFKISPGTHKIYIYFVVYCFGPWTNNASNPFSGEPAAEWLAAIKRRKEEQVRVWPHNLCLDCWFFLVFPLVILSAI